jgi:drug/metabolite transporter (DMT)-like permease
VVLDGSSAAEITFGRFFIYGIISLASLGLTKIRQVTWRIFGVAFLFAMVGNVAYYFILTVGIQLSGAPFAILITGMLPVTVSLFGRIATREGGLREIALPLGLFMLGVLTFNLGKTEFLGDLSGFSIVGTLCLSTSLSMWTWYAVANARFLRIRSGVNVRDWSSLVGVASLVAVVLAAPMFYALGDLRDPSTIPSRELQAIALWSIVLGGGATWLGTILFNLASRLLKVSLLGQLIIFEAIFGIFYVFLAGGALPNVTELVGVALALLGIWWSIRRLQREA